jgi:hypothetical protein
VTAFAKILTAEGMSVFYEALMMNDTSHAIAGEELRKKINPLFIRAPSPKPLAQATAFAKILTAEGLSVFYEALMMNDTSHALQAKSLEKK